MRRYAMFLSLIFITLMAHGAAFAQKGCEFKISGTWKAVIPGEATPLLYRFTPEGTVTVLSAARSEHDSDKVLGSATYTLDDLKAPESISFTTPVAAGMIAQGTTPMEIIGYDDVSLTVVRPGSGPIRLVKVDASNYYLVLAGRRGVFYDGSGPAFPMLIKKDGEQMEIDAVGTYAVSGKWVFGSIPAQTYNDFMKETRKDSEVMFRLRIAEAQYERALKIVRTWERRARELTLLYPNVEMSNILLVKQVTESLNQCGGERIKMYNLDWGLKDHISEITADNPASLAPFKYFKELRRLNESLHVRDEQFHEPVRSSRAAGQ